MIYSITKAGYSLHMNVSEHHVSISGGHFGSLELLEDSLFELTLENVENGEEKTVTSLSNWEKTDCRQYGNTLRISQRNPEKTGDVMVVLTAAADNTGIDWKVEVINGSTQWSVVKMSYPSIKVEAKYFDMFIPDGAGRRLQDIGNTVMEKCYDYPHIESAMQYYAFWNHEGGIYLGVHDPDAAMKQFFISTGNGSAKLKADTYGINAGIAANTFALGGKMRWEYFSGDWYDAAMIYAKFVREHANWLPEIDENGRPDTAQKFKDIPFWAVDYIPNSVAQRDARPMVLGTVSQLYDANYWFEAPIELKKQLGTPMAYHVYNWHEIPFNINYPHYTPAREEFYRGMSELKEADIMVMPYINSVSWEEHDADEGFEINFENTGYRGAAVDKDGKPYCVPYPQKKADGEKTHLIPMCPGFQKWHELIEHEVREIERTMEVSGVYFDEIAAHSPHPCRSKEHGHLPGGGSYWSDGYNLMMSKIRMDKPEEAFYFTECNGEPYMKSFDGFLTWLWCSGDSVPAYPAVYAGYIQMIGRFTDGGNREDEVYFRFHVANSLLYGQQLGWCNAAVVYNEKRMQFLKKLVQTRYKYTKIFNCGKLLRPPVIKSDLAPIVSSDIAMEQLLGGAWQMRDGSETFLFAVNIAEEPAECTISFDHTEYGIDISKIPEEFAVNGSQCSGKVVMNPMEIKVWKI